MARRAAKLYQMCLGWNPEIEGVLCDVFWLLESLRYQDRKSGKNVT